MCLTIKTQSLLSKTSYFIGRLTVNKLLKCNGMSIVTVVWKKCYKSFQKRSIQSSVREKVLNAH